MKNIKVSGLFKILLTLIAAVMCLCSCDTVGKAAGDALNSVVNSAKNEVSNAISENIDELKEGEDELKEQLGEITSALSEASDAVKSAGGEVSSVISSISDEAGAEISEAVSAASDAAAGAGGEISSVISSVSDEVGAEISDAVSQISVSAEETTVPATEKSDKWYTFRNKTRYDEHYEKHGAEFGNITKEQYLQLANDLINNTSDRVLHKYSEDGDYMYFDQDSGYFLVLSEDGYIRTFFIPTAGINYWNRQ